MLKLLNHELWVNPFLTQVGLHLIVWFEDWVVNLIYPDQLSLSAFVLGHANGAVILNVSNAVIVKRLEPVWIISIVGFYAAFGAMILIQQDLIGRSVSQPEWALSHLVWALRLSALHSCQDCSIHLWNSTHILWCKEVRVLLKRRRVVLLRLLLFLLQFVFLWGDLRLVEVDKLFHLLILELLLGFLASVSYLVQGLEEPVSSEEARSWHGQLVDLKLILPVRRSLLQKMIHS